METKKFTSWEILIPANEVGEAVLKAAKVRETDQNIGLIKNDNGDFIVRFDRPAKKRNKKEEAKSK